MPRRSKYSPELRERAVRMVLESEKDYPHRTAAIKSVAGMLGIGSPEQLRKWVCQAEIDQGSRPGMTTSESAELKRLKKENAELRRANEILKAASAFFTAGLDRPGRFSSSSSTPGSIGSRSSRSATRSASMAARSPRAPTTKPAVVASHDVIAGISS